MDEIFSINDQKVESCNAVIANKAQEIYENTIEFENIINKINSLWEDDGKASVSFYDTAVENINKLKRLSEVCNNHSKTITTTIANYRENKNRTVNN